MINSTLSCKVIRELYMKAYNENKAEIDKRIEDGIEANRKGYCRLILKDKSGNPIPLKSIKILQKNHDFKYGANIFMLDEFTNEKHNAEYRNFFKEHFNLATVPFYWDALEPNEGKPRFAKESEKIYRRPAPELCVEYCEENGILPKLHCLFYDKFAPEWMHKLSLSEAEAKFEKRVCEIAERYKGRMYEFEVVNELLCYWDNRTALFYKKDIIKWAFDIARKYLPGETLVINETTPVIGMAEQEDRFPYWVLIENSLLKGAKIDKIGIQNHLFTGVSAHTSEQYDDSIKSGVNMNNPLTYFKGLDILSRFNLPIEITEITVPTFGDTEEYEELQADMLKLWFSVFFSHEAVDAVVYWNTVDGYAYNGNSNWIEDNCRGGLWHHDLTPKKSAVMLKKLFNEIWHTDLEMLSNENGMVDFRGFYGEYEAEIDGINYNFAMHKNQDSTIEIEI